MKKTLSERLGMIPKEPEVYFIRLFRYEGKSLHNMSGLYIDGVICDNARRPVNKLKIKWEFYVFDNDEMGLFGKFNEEEKHMIY